MKHSVLAEEIAEELWSLWLGGEHDLSVNTDEVRQGAALIDQKLSGVREAIKPFAEDYENRKMFKAHYTELLLEALKQYESLKVE